MRDPTSLNKPSTRAIPAADMLQSIPGLDVHWGLVFGVVACIVAHVLMMRSVFGFGAAIAGGNLRAAHAVRAPRAKDDDHRLGARGAAPRGSRAWPRWRQCTGARTRRSSPDTGTRASSWPSWRATSRSPSSPWRCSSAASAPATASCSESTICPTRRSGVLQGILFVVILASETLYGRFAFFRPREERVAPRPVAGAAPEVTG